jgi:hypothetical protein
LAPNISNTYGGTLTRAVLRILLILRVEVVNGVRHDVTRVHRFLSRERNVDFSITEKNVMTKRRYEFPKGDETILINWNEESEWMI